MDSKYGFTLLTPCVVLQRQLCDSSKSRLEILRGTVYCTTVPFAPYNTVHVLHRLAGNIMLNAPTRLYHAHTHVIDTACTTLLERVPFRAAMELVLSLAHHHVVLETCVVSWSGFDQYSIRALPCSAWWPCGLTMRGRVLCCVDRCSSFDRADGCSVTCLCMPPASMPVWSGPMRGPGAALAAAARGPRPARAAPRRLPGGRTGRADARYVRCDHTATSSHSVNEACHQTLVAVSKKNGKLKFFSCKNYINS